MRATVHFRWVVCAFVMLLHWMALVLLYLESAPQNAGIKFENREGFRRAVGLLVYGLPTFNADDCNMELCFNRTLCGTHADNFTISLYPPGDSIPIGGFYVNLVEPSKWWIRVRTALRYSKYFIEDPSRACVIVPNFEHTLAANEAGTAYLIAKTLRNSDTWERYGRPGTNHLLFNKNDDIGVEFDTSYAMVAKVGWSDCVYRPSFDISLSPPLGKSGDGLHDKHGKPVQYWKNGPEQAREIKYFLTFVGTFINHPLRAKLAKQFHDPSAGIYIQDPNCGNECEVLDYVDSLLYTQFALCPRGLGLYSYRVAEAISVGAIPVIIGDRYVYPFEEILDWRTFAVIIPEASWKSTLDVLRSFTQDEIKLMRHNMWLAYQKMYSSDQAMMDMTLNILQMNIYDSNSFGIGQFKHIVSHPSGHPFYQAIRLETNTSISP